MDAGLVLVGLPDPVEVQGRQRRRARRRPAPGCGRGPGWHLRPRVAAQVCGRVQPRASGPEEGAARRWPAAATGRAQVGAVGPRRLVQPAVGPSVEQRQARERRRAVVGRPRRSGRSRCSGCRRRRPPGRRWAEMAPARAPPVEKPRVSGRLPRRQLGDHLVPGPGRSPGRRTDPAAAQHQGAAQQGDGLEEGAEGEGVDLAVQLQGVLQPNVVRGLEPPAGRGVGAMGASQ